MKSLSENAKGPEHFIMEVNIYGACLDKTTKNIIFDCIRLQKCRGMTICKFRQVKWNGFKENDKNAEILLLYWAFDVDFWPQIYGNASQENYLRGFNDTKFSRVLLLSIELYKYEPILEYYLYQIGNKSMTDLIESFAPLLKRFRPSIYFKRSLNDWHLNLNHYGQVQYLHKLQLSSNKFETR